VDAILIIGRILFGALFVTSGLAHFAKLEAMTGYAKYKKLPAAARMYPSPVSLRA